MRKIASLVLSLILISSTLSYAEVLKPVKWNHSLKKLNDKEYEVSFTAKIDKGWHMYGMNIPEGGPIATSFNADEALVDGFIPSVAPEVKFDKTFEIDVELFHGEVSFTKIVDINEVGGKFKGFIEFMACDDSRCLPPDEYGFEILLSDKAMAQESALDQPVSDASGNEEKGLSLLVIFLQSLAAGLLAILTPCVYPIIPLTVSFFSRETKSKAATFMNVFTFGFSIVIIYTSVGLISGLLQVDITNLIASHWLPNLIFFALFLLLAASFFGMFEITLPNSFANKIDQKADKGGLIGSFFMALATVVISFSCTGPIAGVALGSAMMGDIVTPVVGMFGFGLAFALPFTLLAIFPKALQKMPKSGGWLNSVKVFFAFILLFFSLIFLGNLGGGAIPRDFILALAVVILLLLGFYLLGKLKFSHDSDIPYISVPRVILAIATFAFAIYLFTGIFGAPLKKVSPFLPDIETLGIKPSSHQTTQSDLAPVASLCSDSPKYADELHLPHGLKGYFDYEEAIACAKEQGKPVFIDFVGHSCKNCKKMYAEVWSDPKVLNKLGNDFITVALYTDDRTKLPESEWVTSSIDGKLKKTMGKKNLDFQVSKFSSNALPMYAIVDADGNILTDQDIYTYNTDVNKFLDYLNNGLASFESKKPTEKQFNFNPF